MQKMFDRERQTVQKIIFSSMFRNLFTLNFSLSPFQAKYLPMNIRKNLVFQQLAVSIESGS